MNDEGDYCDDRSIVMVLSMIELFFMDLNRDKKISQLLLYILIFGIRSLEIELFERPFSVLLFVRPNS